MPVDLQTPRPAQELTEEFAIKGGLRLQLDELISAVRIIPDRRRKYAMGHGDLGAGGAGNRTQIVLTNDLTEPPGSTIHVHKIWLSSAEATLFEIAWPTAGVVGLAAFTSEAFIDGRNGAGPQANFGGFNNAVETASLNFGRFENWANNKGDNVKVQFDPPIIIAPFSTGGFRSALILKPAGDNQGLVANVLWSEPPDPV